MRPQHDLVWVQSCGMFVCSVCGSRYRRRSRGLATTCHGIKQCFLDACCKAAKLGHNMYVARLPDSNAFSFAYCRLCYHYTTCRVSKLKDSCNGPLSRRVSRARRIQSGLHPTFRVELSGHAKFCEACFGYEAPHTCGLISPKQEVGYALQEVCVDPPPVVNAPCWGFDRGEAEAWEMEEPDDEEGPMEPW